MGSKYYVAEGSVRGECGHRHKSASAAYRCACKDANDCSRLAGNAYSDRSVWGYDENGNRFPVYVRYDDCYDPEEVDSLEAEGNEILFV